MSDMDEFVEGDSHSEAADAAETEAPRGDATQGGFDSGTVTDSAASATPRGKALAARAESRKAFAAAVLANKAKPAAAVAPDNDILDPDEPAPVAPPAAKAPKPADAAPPAAHAAPAAAPPAPSLDPEVRKLREEMKREREAIQAERAELEKTKAVPVTAAVTPPDLERYLDNAPTAFRQWLEDMRGEKLSDDDFKAEMSDFITMASGDVLGVPLPENVRTKLEAAQAKKMVRTHKTLMTKREQESAARAEKDRQAAAEKAETERIEHEWSRASDVIGQRLAGDAADAKAHPWLAAEDEPGKIVVDVIRAALNKDGTQLSWQEAAKQANSYLESEAKKYYDKRKPLLGGAVTPAAKPAVPAPKPAAAAPAPSPTVAATPSGNTRWSNDKHRENTRAAFRAQLAKPE